MSFGRNELIALLFRLLPKVIELGILQALVNLLEVGEAFILSMLVNQVENRVVTYQEFPHQHAEQGYHARRAKADPPGSRLCDCHSIISCGQSCTLNDGCEQKREDNACVNCGTNGA